MSIIRKPNDALSEAYIRRYREAVAPSTIDRTLAAVLTRAEGTRVWDTAGKEYIDFCAGVAVNALGHNHPAILGALHKHLELCLAHQAIDFVEANGVYYSFPLALGGREYEISPAALAEKLLSLMFPMLSPEEVRFIYMVEGTSAVDAAIKLCLKARPGCHRFVRVEQGFHGRRGYGFDGTNSKPIQKKDYVESRLTWYTIPFPDSPENRNRAIEILKNTPTDGRNALLLEYLQGEGGFRWPRVLSWLEDLLEAARREGYVVIVDDIQAGLGRTGKWFSYQWGSFVPDIVVCGKALGGGIVPISGIGYRRAIFGGRNDDEVLENGHNSGTFPGYPLAITAASAFLDTMCAEHLVERVRTIGSQLMDTLLRHANANGLIHTGFGLMQGLEFRKPDPSDPEHHRTLPDPKRRDAALRALREAEPVGIFTFPAGIDDKNPVIRFSPPYIITEREIDYLDETLGKVLRREI